MTINFVLEDGHRNIGDARRLFDLFKADALPEWQHFVGTFDVSKKNSPGVQAADFLAYCVYRSNFSNTAPHPRRLRSRPMSQTRPWSRTNTLGSRCRNLDLCCSGY